MELTPNQIVAELDKYIIGQNEAKKAVAVALRNNYRRNKLPKELRDEITPKNIIMQGPTGVGKTEIARRLAKLINAPFVKVEATKFTEVGYVGRDVESMVRDLVEVAVRMVKEEQIKNVEKKAKAIVDEEILKALYISRKAKGTDVSPEELKAQIEKDYADNKCDSELVEVEVNEVPKQNNIANGVGFEINLSEMFSTMFPAKKKRKTLTVKEAKTILLQQEAEKLVDLDNVNEEAIRKVEQEGIIFIDEIDKITSSSGASKGNGPEVSREGVQRDILPIVEGSTVSTKYGFVKTDYILFIAAGAFHISKVEDLIPELQGRFPIRVKLNNLNKEDFIRILTQPQNAIIKQYQELLKVDNINLVFEDDALMAIAELAEKENETSENIGARRLHTILEQLLLDLSFNAGSNDGIVDVIINKEYVDNTFKGTTKEFDLKKYII